MVLSINKTYCWIFVTAFVLLVPSIHLLKFIDELMVLVMMCLVALDVVVNHNFKKYKFIFAVMGIMMLYFLYSFTLPYNTPTAFVYDFIAQMKPFCYFGIAYAIAPQLDNTQKYVLKVVAILNAVIMLFLFVTGMYKIVVFHITYIGLIAAVSFMLYLLASVKDDGTLSKRDTIIAVAILTIGLTCTRSKFYGEYIMALYMLFVYRPGMLKNIKWSHILIFFAILGLIIVAAWEKIDYYFISGGQDIAPNEDVLESFARPLLYGGLILTLIMHPLFGSGLASFATNASSTSVNYSELYRVIGLDEIWGLSPDFDAFICDTFYPSLAQFGLVGIVLLIVFFVWNYKRLGLVLDKYGKIEYIIGIFAIVVLLIESIAATTFNQGVGGICLMTMGYMISQVKDIESVKRIKEK